MVSKKHKAIRSGFPPQFSSFLQCLAVPERGIISNAGFTFSNAIQCGVLKPHLGVRAIPFDGSSS
jgi:hypothetical protein